MASSSGKTFDQVNATAANTKYTINKYKWHPYVTIDGKRWATENIGATATNPNGHYFAWGYTEGCVRNSANDGWVLASDNTTARQFNNSTYTSKTASTFEDAAYANWGGDWRMPTSDEFHTLLKNRFSAWTNNFNSQSVKGLIVWEAQSGDAGYYKPANYSSNQICRKIEDNGTTSYESHLVSYNYESTTPLIFFPAAGYGNISTLSTSSNYFWSSTFDSSGKALILNFRQVNPNDDLQTKCACMQYIGMPIRPVSD